MSANSVSFCGDDSDDSLPDLQSRISAKLSPFRKVERLVHTLSSDEDSESEITEEPTQESSEEHNFNQLDGDLNKDCGKNSNHAVDIIPEIEDITFICEEPSRKTPPKCSKPSDDTSSKPKKKLISEALRAEKGLLQNQRRLLREEKAAQKAQLKAEKEKEKLLKKSMKPGECIKFMEVELDRRLLEDENGSLLLGHLQISEIKYQITDLPIASSIRFRRVNPVTGQKEDEPQAIVVIPVAEFVAMVWSQLYGGQTDKALLDECLLWKTSLERQNLTIIVCGLDSYFRGHKVNNERQFRAAVLGEENAARRGQKRKKDNQNFTDIKVSRVDVETVLVQLQIECDINHRLLNSPQKLAVYVTQISKAIAEAPFKRDKSDGFTYYAEGCSFNTVRVDKNGIGLLKLWHQQLQQFNNVGVEVAQAIANVYPSPTALFQAYSRCSSNQEGAKLLADIPVRRGTGPLVSSRRVGPELSRKIHAFFTSEDPELSLALR
ncbi:methyl methanesulfonate sensitivity 4 isoform X2 [Oratosquilla oratoria]